VSRKTRHGRVQCYDVSEIVAMIVSAPRIPRRSDKPLSGERQARRYGTHATHLSASVAYQKLTRARWWSRAITSKSLSTNIIKDVQGKCIGPTSGFVSSPEVGPGGHYWYPTDRVPVTPHVSKPHDYINHMFMRP
jgi:hypothetical protein